MKTVKLFGMLLLTVLFTASCQIKKNIGLQMYSLRQDIGQNSKNVDSIILKIGQMGYKYVETANYSDGLIYNMQPEVFKSKLKTAGLYASSCHVGRDLSGKMDEVWAWWDKCIAAHKAAGIKYIITPSMPRLKTIEELQKYCDYFNQIGEKCKAAGLKFGYHNHSFEFEQVYDGGISMFDYMVQHTNPDNVFF
jgi:sugar phosphate isomerase/epimerase